MSRSNSKLITRIETHTRSQTFEWQDTFHCKYCGVRGYYELERDADDAMFCSGCGHTDCIEFYAADTVERMLARESNTITDKLLITESVERTAEEWKLVDAVNERMHRIRKKFTQGIHDFSNEEIN